MTVGNVTAIINGQSVTVRVDGATIYVGTLCSPNVTYTSE